MIRLFAALPLNDRVLDQLERVITELRELEWPVRWVQREKLHITMKFFGEVPDEQRESISLALGAAARGTPPLPMSLTNAGVFPSWRRPRVIWIGLDAPPALELFQHRVERESAAIGFPVEGAPFMPHITLGRVTDSGRLPGDALARLRKLTIQADFVADTLVLFESRQTARGAVYQPSATFALRN